MLQRGVVLYEYSSGYVYTTEFFSRAIKLSDVLYLTFFTSCSSLIAMHMKIASMDTEPVTAVLT